jgi:hypothetical protein
MLVEQVNKTIPTITYMMRLAEMYLVYVEAVIGNVLPQQIQLPSPILMRCTPVRIITLPARRSFTGAPTPA